MNYIIYDLEASCWDEDKPVGAENEIIEIGAVILDMNGQERSDFSSFVKPVKFPVLSDFCKTLTSIKQKHVEKAPTFPEVIQQFINWIGEDDFVLCSWGAWDKEQFKRECYNHNIDNQWLSNHLDLKDQYRDIKMLKRTVGFKQALRKEGFVFDGTPHRGIDDAKNLARLFQLYFPLWDFDNRI